MIQIESDACTIQGKILKYFVATLLDYDTVEWKLSIHDFMALLTTEYRAL